MTHLLDLTIDELTAQFAAMDLPAYRAKQVAAWVYQRGATDFAAMTDLPADLRPVLADRYRILSAELLQRLDAGDGVIKLLLGYQRGGRIEAVLIPADGRATACVSTQVGCAIGCEFCASGADGLERNLGGGEIVEQVLHLQQAAATRVTHVVFMGVGEPLANYEATVFAIRAMVDPGRLGISARHVTVSTVGIPKAIRKLAKEDLPITLAISLHAPNDALRRQIIPHAPAAIDEVLAAAREFYQARRRELTLEYVLLAGVNDTNVCAEGLARIAHSLRCNVNLIRYNPASTGEFRRPTQAAVEAFARRLEQRGVNVQVRRSRGLEAQAACGQLRRHPT